ncbi:MAG: hypothetical protein BJ554DRAFT_4399, partial [Olpidium bornovanus]
VSRRFGYIGYSTAEDARAAIEYFNNTFIYTSKIQVEEANKESENAAKLAEQKAKREKLLKELCEDDENEKLKEYLEVVQPRSKAKTWTNDDGLAKVAKQAAKVAKQGRAPVISTSTAKDRSKSDDDYQDLPKDHASEGIFEEEVADEADDGAKTLAHDQSVSDLDYLRSKMKSSISLLDETRGENEVSSELLADTDTRLDDEKPETKSAADSLAQAECAEEDDPIRQISDTGRLFVRNLPYSTLEEDLRRAFEPFGPLSEVHLPIDKETKAPKGYAYVLYLIPEHAVKAYQAMDRSIYQGRILHVIPAKEKPDLLAGANGESEASGISLKKKKELKRKATSRNEFNWNSLFMSVGSRTWVIALVLMMRFEPQDAVAASIAERLGVSKADIMDPTADNAAVRLALAETQLIAETKEYLEENGIRVTATSSTGGKTKRSDTFLRAAQILIPPAGTMAVVEFLHPSEARAAFSHLAYKRVKSTILYLEKAPVNVFREAYDPSKTDKAAATKAAAAATPAKEAETLKSTLFSANVKNDPDALAVAS